MTNSSYLPYADAQRVGWLNNITVKLPNYQTVLGLSSADVQQITADNAMYAYTVNLLNIVKQSHQHATSFKNLLSHNVGSQQLGAAPALPVLPTAPAMVQGGIFDRTRLLVQRIKNAAGYTDAIGQDLNIVASVSTVDVNTISPVLKAKTDVGRPHLKWKKGTAQATDLYADHNDGNGFVLVARLLRGEYLDTTPLAAGKVADDYKYKAIFVIADEQVGIMSQVLSVRAFKQ
jgi:hypothetical protein